MKYRVDQKKIKKIMIDKDISTIVQLSEESGVSRTKIYDYFNGISPFSTTFIRLCDFLDEEPENLIITYERDDELI